MFVTKYSPINIGISIIIRYATTKEILYIIEIAPIISLNMNSEKPIKIEINKTLKKLSFLLNFPE